MWHLATCSITTTHCHDSLAWLIITTHHHDSLSRLIIMTHHHDSSPWLIITTHYHDSLSWLIITTHHHDSSSRRIIMTHCHDSSSRLIITTHHHDSLSWLIITTHYHDSLSVITPTLFPPKYELMNSLNHNSPFNVPLSRMTRVSLHQNLQTLTHSHPVFVAIDSIFSFLHFLQFNEFIAYLSGLTMFLWPFSNFSSTASSSYTFHFNIRAFFHSIILTLRVLLHFSYLLLTSVFKAAYLK